MPILAVDQFGRIYETSPDRADGLGYGSSPECVDQQDLTLGSSYLKAQERRRHELVQAHRVQAAQDALDSREAANRARRKAESRRRQEAEAETYNHPRVAESSYLAARSQSMGCESCGGGCGHRTVLSGNGLTANGQTGFRGMSRDQQAIYAAVNGLGNHAHHAVDAEEAEQLRHKIAAERILRMKARR